MDFAACRFMCCRENQRCCGCCFRRALGCNRTEVSLTKKHERGPAPKSDSARPLNDVEREIVLADIAYLKQQEIESGDRAKWEKDQEMGKSLDILREAFTTEAITSITITLSFDAFLPEPITEEQFMMATGRESTLYDISRANCKDAGKPGHHFCGWCRTHNKPRWHCNH
jgi:hypothetical protein